jgi:2-polyprenyl-6-methoxyphenol hydroxylase-like FAD-dependent oxidoreductase
MNSQEAAMSTDSRAVIHRDTTTCCIAGCGPAGAVLGLLLARAGVEVLVLEKHADFFRDFRGDTVHPSTLEILEELGLLEDFAKLPHQRVTRLRFWSDRGAVTVADFGDLHVRHPYIAMVPQWDLLDLLADAARRCPAFTLRMESEVVEVIERDGQVSGVRYRAEDGMHEVRADLTVAADGRDSAVRRAAGMVPVDYGAPIDVLWFRLSRRDTDPDESFGRVSGARFMAMINRGSYWQIGYLIRKGSDAALRGQGLPALRSALGELLPFLADRVGELETWDDVKTLQVQVNRLRRWHRPGLLCIGDAAHAMSPIGGVGINLAIQDAVAAANLLAAPLLEGALTEEDLALVQRRRRLPTVVIQTLQRVVQRRIMQPVLSGRPTGRSARILNLARRIRPLRRLPARLVGVGIRPEHVNVGRAGTSSPVG